jgi:hypothetical protein
MHFSASFRQSITMQTTLSTATTSIISVITPTPSVVVPDVQTLSTQQSNKDDSDHHHFSSNEERVLDDIALIQNDLDTLVASWQSAQDVSDSAGRVADAVLLGNSIEAQKEATPSLVARSREWRTDEQRLCDDLDQLKEDLVRLARYYSTLQDSHNGKTSVEQPATRIANGVHMVTSTVVGQVTIATQV